MKSINIRTADSFFSNVFRISSFLASTEDIRHVAMSISGINQVTNVLQQQLKQYELKLSSLRSSSDGRVKKSKHSSVL